ncbi:hypothetical protein [Pseudolysinimonas sp.]|uniref:hypothetical protein n=1 Tax=Pseudolysinimonas sp. TaxID=2680009 RepID=UPI00286CB63B|nr:hypothetical protein [Pseudolysinimonas sp.]
MSRNTESRSPSRTVTRRLAAALAAIVLGLVAAIVPAVSASASGQVVVEVVDQAGNAVVGLDVDFRHASDNTTEVIEASDASGLVTVTLPDDAYFFYVIDGSTDGTSTYGSAYGSVTVSGTDPAPLQLIVNRYVDISGQIDPWTSEMTAAGVEVQLYAYYSSGGFWSGTSFSEVTYDGSYTFPALIFDQPYTLDFEMDEENTPYLDAFLGGFDDPALATQLDGEPGVGFSGLTMSMPPAASISGTVTDINGLPIEGIWIWAEDDPDYNEYVETQTDADGEYTLYVRPGLTYVVHADDWDNDDYVPMTYDGWDGCGCEFDPVTPPASDIDFELVAADTELVIPGVVFDAASELVPDLEVRLFRHVGSAWVLDDVVVSDDGSSLGYPFNFVFYLAESAEFRIQIADSTGKILRIDEGGTSPDLSGAPTSFDPLPACYGDIGIVTDVVFAFVAVDPSTPSGACASLDAGASGGTGGSGSTPAKPRSKAGGSSSVVAPTPTPTPTATPTPSATPRPSASPTPTATPPIEVPPASGSDLWWLLWVAIGTLAIVIVGGVVYVVRRP